MRITFLTRELSDAPRRADLATLEAAAESPSMVQVANDLPPRPLNSRTEVGVIIVNASESQLASAALDYADEALDIGAIVGVALLFDNDPVETDPLAQRLADGRTNTLAIASRSVLATASLRQFLTTQHELCIARAVQIFLDSSSDGYWIWDICSDSVEWSERTRSLTQVAENHLPTTIASFAEMVHPDDRDNLLEAVKEHLGSGQPYMDVPCRIRGEDGEYRDFVATGQALRDASGTPTMMVGAITDLTEQHRTERQLEETRRRYAVMFHNMNDAAVLADPETGLIVEANLPAQRLWKLTYDELIGAHQSTLHPPQLTEEAREAFRMHIEALQRDNRASITLPIVTSDGIEIPTEISSSLVELDDKMMLLGVFRDITEREQAANAIRERDAQLQLASRLAAMGSLAAGVGHEINNPLTYILGNLAFATSQLGPEKGTDPDTMQALVEAMAGAERVRDIVADLKAITRGEDQTQECQPNEIVRIATRIAMADIRHRADVVLELETTGTAGISGSRLTQVLLNVLTNASHSFRHTRTDLNRIVVRVQEAGPYIQIRCEDNGTGITPEDLPSVFEPFFTTKPVSEGTGLGLSICRRILAEVSGTIRIESTMGVGTTVIIDIPKSDSAAKAAEQNPAPNQTGAKVLVLDDDEFIGRVMQRILQSSFVVTVRNDPEVAARELVEGADFDVVLCDLMMPAMCGEQVFQMVSEHRPEMADRMLFVTGGAVTPGCARFEAEMRAKDRVLIKPVVANELVERIHRIVDTSAV